MAPLLSILRAAHCRSTHHFFALDALRLVQTDAGLRLRGILLKHHEKYLTGAKDPDVRFRDFQNHVIHVQDGYFGGAPRLAIQWYDRLMGHLVAQRCEDAAYAMGVLSHYFTDPLMPLHTAQCERETLVHRPMEWSICKSYERILKRWTEDELRLVFQLGDGEGWLGEAILKGARFSNRSYKRLVESYDVDLGVENPVAGLDDAAIQTFAQLFGLAITGLARIIERVADEAENRCGTELRTVSLTMPALFAALQVPEQMWISRITNKEERRAIEAIVGEYRETGQVKVNIPDEIYVKQRVLQVREREAAWNERHRQRIVAQGAVNSQIVASPATSEQTVDPEKNTLESIAAASVADAGLTKIEPTALAASTVQSEKDQQVSEASAIGSQDEVVSVPFAPIAKTTNPGNQNMQERLGIDRADELARAPSIGPKTAAAFAEITVLTIGEFLDAPAAALSRRIAKSWITPTVVEDWQAQTWLMLHVPGLLSRDVQMLVGVGCRTVDQLAKSEARTLAAMMNRYAMSSNGRRSLRGASPADVAQVERWITDAGRTNINRRVA